MTTSSRLAYIKVKIKNYKDNIPITLVSHPFSLIYNLKVHVTARMKNK